MAGLIDYGYPAAILERLIASVLVALPLYTLVRSARVGIFVDSKEIRVVNWVRTRKLPKTSYVVLVPYSGVLVGGLNSSWLSPRLSRAVGGCGRVLT